MNKKDDLEVCKVLWKLFDDADILVGQNSDRFDIKKMNARFIIHGLGKPSYYASIDTLKVARKHFKFDSNKLDEMGRQLGIGRKIEHEGIDLWEKCMKGDKKAWKKMMKYNVQDVLLLEKLYYKFRPWIDNHPNMGFDGVKEYACPSCGSENVHKKGKRPTRTNMYQRWVCMDCGSSSQSVHALKGIVKPKLK